MKYMGMPVALWAVFTRSFRKNLETCFGLNATEAKEVTRKAKVRYKKIIRELPEFEKEDRFKIHQAFDVVPGKAGTSIPDPWYTHRFQDTYDSLAEALPYWLDVVKRQLHDQH